MRIESAAAAVALAFAAASCGTRPVVQSEGHLQTAEVPSRAPLFSVLWMSWRSACSAGASPASRVVARITTIVKASMRPSVDSAGWLTESGKLVNWIQ